MSTDRTTEIINYLSAISREVGALRTEVKSLRTEVSELRTEMNARFDRVESAQRLQGRRLERVEGLMQTARADIEELQDRVDTLEGK